MTRGYQADFPAQQPEAQAAPWLPFAHGDEKRSEDSGSPSLQRPQAALRLIPGGEPRPLPADRNPDPVAVERLRVRREFLYVADGIAERRKLVVVQARRRPEPRPAAGAGFTTTKKVGNSVVRNRARRRLREGARALLPLLGLPGADYVFIARQDTGSAPWTRLLDDMEIALISLRRRLAVDSGPAPGAVTPSPARG